MAEAKLRRPKPEAMEPRPNLKRKPGAQPGNTNAFKHGFYSRRFKRMEIKDLDTILNDGLVDEIALVRVLMRRFFDLAHKKCKTLDEWAQVLSLLGDSGSKLSSMIRTQHMLTGNSSNAMDLLLAGISEAAIRTGAYIPR